MPASALPVGRRGRPESCREERPLSSYRYKLSKPAAVVSAVVGAAVVGMNLWAAFARNGAVATSSRVPDDEDRRSP